MKRRMYAHSGFVLFSGSSTSHLLEAAPTVPDSSGDKSQSGVDSDYTDSVLLTSSEEGES